MHQLPALEELMQAASERRFDCVVVARVHHFGRSLSDFHERLQRLEAQGIRFVGAGQHIDTAQLVHNGATPIRVGDFLLKVAGACSDLELDEGKEYAWPTPNTSPG
jgi:DNA invertase Pin-like site-specific DNA recombinase